MREPTKRPKPAPLPEILFDDGPQNLPTIDEHVKKISKVHIPKD